MSNGSGQRSKHPPRARLALRVGVTGHKDKALTNANRDALCGRIQEVLKRVKDLVIKLEGAKLDYEKGDEPILRVISAVADGADSMVAEEALALGFELQSPLPFDREEYENDFKRKELRDTYRSQLGEATAVLELDGSRETNKRENASYEAAGRMVLGQSDVLIAIWDGQPPKGQGGTGQIVGEAIRLGVPTVWIHSEQPHDMKFATADGGWLPQDEVFGALRSKLHTLLLPPFRAGHPHEQVPPEGGPCADYFSETQKKIAWIGFLWNMFRDLVADFRLRWPAFTLPDFQEATREEWAAVFETSSTFPRAAIELSERSGLLDHYAWADKLANYYANLYRSAYLCIYGLSALAVLLAFLCFAFGLRTLVVPELVTLAVAGYIFRRGSSRRWHERWIDYRLLAEHFRQMLFLIALGPAPLFPRPPPAHASYGDPSNTWMYWHFRAFVREMGMINAHFEPYYLKEVCRFLNCNGIKDQIEYHEKNARRHEHMDHRVHLLVVFLFGLSAVACGVELALLLADWFLGWHEAASKALALFTTVGPAVAAAFAAIRVQGEFERVTKRSEAMSKRLAEISKKLDGLATDEKISSGALGILAADAAELMVGELLDWRVVFQARPLPPPE